MKSLPSIAVTLSAPDGEGRAITVRLNYDPDSPFTWIQPEQAEALSLPTFRERLLRVPNSKDVIRVAMVLVRVEQSIFFGVDEVAVAPRPELARFGERTLAALQVQIERGSESVSETTTPGEPDHLTLVSVTGLEPYGVMSQRVQRELQTRRSPRLERDLPARIALALRYFLTRLTKTTSIAVRDIADALFVTLWRLLGCQRASVACWSPGTVMSVVRQTSAMTLQRRVFYPGQLASAFDSAQGARALSWNIVADRDAFPTESELACYVEPESSAESYLVERLMETLEPLVGFLIAQSALTDALRSSRDDTRKVLAFPRSREQIVSYDLLRRAQRVIPNWAHLAFWRTSRTLGKLEKTAEEHMQKRPTQRDTVDWKLPKGSGATTGAEMREIVAVALPVGASLAGDARARVERMLGLTKLRSLECVTREGPFQVFLPDSSLRSGPRDEQRIIGNLGELLGALSLSGSEIVILAWTFLHTGKEASDLPPKDFHIVVSLVAHQSELSRVNLPALGELRRAVSLRLQSYDVLSWSRYELRQFGNFLSDIHTARDLESFRTRVQETLQALMPASMFLLIEQATGIVLLADNHLRAWQGRVLPVPALEARQPKVCRDLVDELGSAYRELAETTLYVHYGASAAQPGVGISAWAHGRQVERKVGGIFAPASTSGAYALLVVNDGPEGWKVSSSEYSAIRVLSAALELAKPLVELQATEESRWAAPRQLGSSRLERSLLRKESDVPSILEDLLSDFRAELREGGLDDVDAALLAVDGGTPPRFCRIIAGQPATSGREQTVALGEPSMVHVAVQASREGARPFSVLLGRLDASGKRVAILVGGPLPRTDDVAFHGLVPARPGDLIAVRGFTRSNDLALGFLVVRLGSDDRVREAGCIDRATAAIDGTAERASLVLQRQIELRASEMRRATEEHLRGLKRAEVATLTKLTALRSETERDTGHLPAPIRRVFTSKFCENLQRILNATMNTTGIASISCRIRYPDSTGRDHLWRLAAVGKGDFKRAYEFDPALNVHSYVADIGRAAESNERVSDSEILRTRVFLPFVQSVELNEKLHSGLNYHAGHSGTEAELCFGVGIPGRERLWVTLNVEHTRFFDLWLLEEIFRQTASRMGEEVALHYRRAEVADENAVNLARMFARSLTHFIVRDLGAGPDIGESVENRKRAQLETEIADRLSGTPTEPLDDQLERARDLFRALMPDGPEVRILPAAPCEAPPRVSPSFSSLLAKLLFEQAGTLQKIRQLTQPRFFAIGWRLSSDGRGVRVDLLNNVPPEREETRDLAEALFWYEIDLKAREAKGTDGSGLYLIGLMLRLIGCRPVAHPRPTVAMERHYSDALPEIARGQTGLAFELCLPQVSLAVDRESP